MMRTLPAYLFPTLLLLAACRKDRPEPPVATPILAGQGGVYITNEGNFGWGNAGVSYFDKASGAVAEDLFSPANGAPLGDVCQSMHLFNGRAYVVINNSGKVVVVDPNSFTLIATISGFSSPRYFLPVSSGKAYVTDLAANAISVVDLSTRTIVRTIRCPGWTEQLALAHGKAFVTNQSRAWLYVIDTATDVLEDSIPVSRGGNSIVEDGQGMLWVACSGGSGTAAAIYRVDPVQRAVTASYPFTGQNDSPWRLTRNGTGDVLYFLNSGVFQMPIGAGSLPMTPFIPSEGRTFYALGVDPADGTVYVADALDYVQRGVVFRYTTSGTLLGQFLAGRIPGSFVFR